MTFADAPSIDRPPCPQCGRPDHLTHENDYWVEVPSMWEPRHRRLCQEGHAEAEATPGRPKPNKENEMGRDDRTDSSRTGEGMTGRGPLGPEVDAGVRNLAEEAAADNRAGRDSVGTRGWENRPANPRPSRKATWEPS